MFPGPMFHTVPHEERLSPEDAELVDVIHTAGRWLGMDGVVRYFNSLTCKIKSYLKIPKILGDKTLYLRSGM